MKAIKIYLGEWINQSRDEREISVLKKLGLDVEVVVKGEKSETVVAEDDIVINRLTTRPFGLKGGRLSTHILAFFSWVKYVRGKDVDVISGHDYLGVLIGYLSNFGKHRKAKLVYDSHEFELGRTGKTSKTRAYLISKIEPFLMKKCEFSIMVNDSIANEMQKIYALEERPIVVRNIPQYFHIEEKQVIEKRKELIHNMNVQENTFLIMYHGLIAENRGIEVIIDCVSNNKNIAAVLLGYGQSLEYINRLKELVEEKKCKERILFHKAVPLKELYKYVAAADAEMIVIPNLCKSYYYGLPNKFFESIQSITPIISSNFPEMKRIIDNYGIGITCNPDNIEEINASVEKLRLDKSFYDKCKSNLKKAKEELCWENEQSVLVEAYRKII